MEKVLGCSNGKLEINASTKFSLKIDQIIKLIINNNQNIKRNV